MAAAVLLLFTAIPRQQCVRDTVDVIEVNHVVDGNCTPVFSQVIFWRWNYWDSRYEVVAWRILKGVREQPKQLKPEPECWKGPAWIGGHATPLRRYDRGGWWLSQWKDERDRCWREVAAPMHRETWTLRDPEVDNREWLPRDQRRGLSRPRKR